MRTTTMVAVLLALMASPLAAQDSIPLAWPVAPGGVSYEVRVGGEWVDGALIGGEVWSAHQRLDTALREASRYVLEDCQWTCPPIWIVPAPLRIDIRAIVPPVAADPDPNAVDSVSAYPPDEPAGTEPDTFRSADLYWIADRPRLCVTVAAEPGLIDVLLQDLDGYAYDWLVAFHGGQWLPGTCDTPQATLAAIPTEDQPTLAVGVIDESTATPPEVPEEPDEPEDPGDPPEMDSTPQWTAEADGAVRWTWEAVPGATAYRVRYEGADTYTATPEVVLGGFESPWLCVHAIRGEVEGGPRCNAYDPTTEEASWQ